VQTNEQEQISLNIVMRLWFHKTSHYMQLMQLSMSLHLCLDIWANLLFNVLPSTLSLKISFPPYSMVTY